jgi:hypothetical protein
LPVSQSPLASQQTTQKKEVEKSGIYAHFFGPDGRKELSYTEFEAFIRSLHQGVLQLEFERYDTKGEGRHFLIQRRSVARVLYRANTNRAHTQARSPPARSACR